jgi:hypothetical protein
MVQFAKHIIAKFLILDLCSGVLYHTNVDILVGDSSLLPTPVQHLVIAEKILASSALPDAIRTQICQNKAVCGAFFLGHIAPDVQVVSGQSRESTHFFALPPINQRPAYEIMLAKYPNLVDLQGTSPAQLAFTIGYISHLMLDECWVREVFFPVFGPDQIWGDRRERFLLHNVLRTWLDQHDLPKLREGIDNWLRYAHPNGWLPFVEDRFLRQWRDLVADQFAPGAGMRTVEIFAKRSRIPDAEFLALLEPEAMQRRVFSRISLEELNRFYERAVARTHDLTLLYWNGCIVGESV